jgi:preprotein translocase subunit YajC
MNKFLWSTLIFIATGLFLSSFFVNDISFAIIALILTFILDRNKPYTKRNKKKTEFLKGIKKGRKFENE